MSISSSHEGPSVLLRSSAPVGAPHWMRFRQPLCVIRATTAAEVLPALAEVRARCAHGCYAAGFLTYEAAPAFDAALTTHGSTGPLPLLWFSIYADVERFATLPEASSPYAAATWQFSMCHAEYQDAVRRVREYIAAGDTYQVNLTQRLHTTFAGDAYALFHTLYHAQHGRYCACIDTEAFAVCSVSPELFFSLCDGEITCRPMKGTAARGVTQHDDRQQRDWLHGSEKNRAENLMIVDMMRNDLGKVAIPGSVKVPKLFSVERYDTLWQMTSTVTARTEAGIVEIMRALFPCASITGAPKVRTMEIIRELEASPRGLYTGAIGYLAPDGHAQFNVAIRTVTIDKMTGEAEYGVGGGIVWDSDAESEYRECCTKALVLTAPREPFSLLETLRWSPGTGYALLDAHLRRLADSAAYFGFALALADVRGQLAAFAGTLGDAPQRVRLLVNRAGEITLTTTPLPDEAPRTWSVALAPSPIDMTDPFLYHKTTRRAVYDAARAACPGVDDVLLWNEREEVTESTIANLVARFDGAWVTPPVSCGLLPGTLRASLLAAGVLRERVITLADLHRVEACCLINSVRGWTPLSLDRITPLCAVQ